MAWFNDYSRDFDRGAGYDRGRNRRDTPGWRSSNYGYDRGWNTRGTAWGGYGNDNRGGYWGESSTRPGYGRDYLGRQFGYDSEYDYAYRQRHPENSPFYGRDADQEVQRWARRYGYDMQFQIDPRQGGRGQQQGGYGGTTGRQQRGGWGGSSGRGMNRGNRF